MTLEVEVELTGRTDQRLVRGRSAHRTYARRSHERGAWPSPGRRSPCPWSPRACRPPRRPNQQAAPWRIGGKRAFLSSRSLVMSSAMLAEAGSVCVLTFLALSVLEHPESSDQHEHQHKHPETISILYRCSDFWDRTNLNAPKLAAPARASWPKEDWLSN